jgi:hypothetical protein
MRGSRTTDRPRLERWLPPIVLLLSATLPAQNVLSYYDDCGPSVDPVPAAVAAIPGASLTTTTTLSLFATTYDGGSWDVVIIGVYGNYIDQPLLDRANLHATGGGRVIFFYWAAAGDGLTASHPLFTSTCPVTMISDYGTPLPVHTWDPGHPIWTTPNTIGPFPLTHYQDGCGLDGQHAEPTGGSIAIGGYTAAPTPNEAAIILSPGGEVIYNTFVLYNYPQATIEDLVEN